MTDATIAAQHHSRARRIFSAVVHHHGVHIGANAFSSLQGIVLGCWIAYVFWITRSAPSGLTVAWIVGIYLIFEEVTAALTVVRKDRWVSVLTDFGVSVALVIEIGFVWYDHTALAILGVRADTAGVLTFILVGSLFGSLLLTMIVNTRVIGGAPISVTAPS